MIRILSVILVLIVYSPVFAAEQTCGFAWDYTAEEEANIDGFIIFLDGGSEENVVWEGVATDRTATVTFEDDGKSHTFSAVAYKNLEDGASVGSDQSNYIIWTMPIQKPSNVGNFRRLPE